MRLKGRLSRYLVVLVVILLLDGKKILLRKKDILVPVLSVPLEETLCSCPSDLLQSRRNEVSLWTAVRYHVLIVPDEVRLDWVDMFSSRDMILFPERISANSLPYCFDSGFIPHTFQTYWPSPVFNTPKFLITFNFPIDEISRNVQWFQEIESLRIWFSALVKGNHSHAVFLQSPLHVNTAKDVSKLPRHKYLKG